MYQDNTAAFNADVSGSGRSPSVSAVAGRFHITANALQASLWIEHVDTKAMLTDIPSRLSHQQRDTHQAEYDALGCRTKPAVFPQPDAWVSNIVLFNTVRQQDHT